MKIARGSRSWILFAFICSLIFLCFSIVVSSVIFQSVFFLVSTVLLLLTGFFIMFFRDPSRVVGKGLVAVADGKIRDIKKTNDEDVGKCIIVSTFMNVHNVHVNRMPLNGVVKDINHISGSYLPAFKKESDQNERVIIKIETYIGVIKIIQIAGTLARRIVPYIKKGDKLKKGDKIGIIRLGSRVDVYLPNKKNLNLTVMLNDRVKAGVNSLAEIND